VTSFPLARGATIQHTPLCELENGVPLGSYSPRMHAWSAQLYSVALTLYSVWKIDSRGGRVGSRKTS